jgi:hypothetical protein
MYKECDTSLFLRQIKKLFEDTGFNVYVNWDRPFSDSGIFKNPELTIL